MKKLRLKEYVDIKRKYVCEAYTWTYIMPNHKIYNSKEKICSWNVIQIRMDKNILLLWKDIKIIRWRKEKLSMKILSIYTK